MNRAEFAVHARRHRVASFYLQGKFQSDIAQLVGISQQQVSHDLKALHTLWLQEMVQDLDARKSVELKRLDRIEVAAWEGWERSLQPREITLTEATEGGETTVEGVRVPRPATRKASMRKEGQAGDPRFLQTVQKCVERRCAILGLNAPTTLHVDDEMSGLSQVLKDLNALRSSDQAATLN
jgi:hypothetical protein